MGKDLKGKELGVGISQRKDGLYTGRYTNRKGERKQKYFKKLQDCRKWIADMQYQNEHCGIEVLDDICVDSWFWYWLDEIKSHNIRENTIRNYRERYDINIKEYIGDMLLRDVRPVHCQQVLNRMADSYANSTIDMARMTMYAFFEDAVQNDIIQKNPVTRSVKCTSGKPVKKARILTIQEQKKFLEAIRGSSNYNQYAFLLQTGLRTGEMIGLKWSNVDFANKVIHIDQTMEYRYSVGEWKTGPPKSKSGYRTIPLTNEAISILQNQRDKLKKLKVIPIEYSEYVFLSRKGEPTKNSTYDTKLYYYCDKAGIERFSMHTLRHTFATRCIEAGMRPKTLQVILGHSNISITMNLYVHVTEESKVKEVESIEDMLKIV